MEVRPSPKLYRNRLQTGAEHGFVRIFIDNVRLNGIYFFNLSKKRTRG